ncbi:hypothetical protein AAMO2058_000601200 [Amorphochlora amoebiformis]
MEVKKSDLKYFGGGLAAGIALGSVCYAMWKYLNGRDEHKLLMAAHKLMQADFFKFKNSILYKISLCPSIKFTPKELEAIYDKFFKLSSGAPSIKKETMKGVYYTIFTGCNFPLESKQKIDDVLNNWMKLFDADGDLHIDLIEVILRLNDIAFAEPSERMETLFNVMSVDGRRMSFQDLELLVNLTVPNLDVDLKKKLLDVIKKLDGRVSGRPADGNVDHQEWMKMLDNVGWNPFGSPSDFEVALLEYFGITRRT